MTKNPIINAVAAGLSIVIIGLVMDFGTRYGPKGYSIIAPIAIISLFTLSTAVMGYLFGYLPMQLFLEGKKREAVKIFLQTVFVFFVFTILSLGLLFSGILK